MIPLISSLCKGPLGAAQLPRLWWKNLLKASGHLNADYPHCSGGLDIDVIQMFKLDKEQTLGYLQNEKPDYLQFEAWVEQHGTIDPQRIERWSKALAGRTHRRPEKIDETYADIGYDQAEVTEVSAVLLNDLQDWQLFHREDLMGNLSKMMPPLLSSIDVGPLGICQLPRTWLKTCLRAKGLLHEDYPDCAEGSLDQHCIKTLELDQEQTLAFLRENLPTYLQFEDWVQQEGQLDDAEIAAFNERLLGREHIPAKLEDIHSTLGRKQTWTRGVLLNNLEDWHYAHRALTEV